MARGRANEIGAEPELEGEEGLVTEKDSQSDLEQHNAADNPFGERFRAAEFGDFRMCLDDCTTPAAVGFFLVRPIEVLFNNDFSIMIRSSHHDCLSRPLKQSENSTATLQISCLYI